METTTTTAQEGLAMLSTIATTTGIVRQVHEANMLRVDADFRNGVVPSPNFEPYEASSMALEDLLSEAAKLVAEAAWANGHVPGVGTVLADSNGPLVLVGATVTRGWAESSVRVEFTDDGGEMISSWHRESDGAEADGVRYVAFVIEGGRVAERLHGFIDSASRKITQVGQTPERERAPGPPSRSGGSCAFRTI